MSTNRCRWLNSRGTETKSEHFKFLLDTTCLTTLKGKVVWYDAQASLYQRVFHKGQIYSFHLADLSHSYSFRKLLCLLIRVSEMRQIGNAI